MRTSCNYIFAVALIVLMFAGFSCKQDELKDLGFPRLNTLYVEMIPDTGAVFKGEILEIPGDCEIIDHGFVWSESKDATSSIEKLSLGETNKTGIFSAIANRAMVEGKKYYFKSFVETSTTTVFGNEIEFVSLGSHAPVITSISPTSASWKDTVYIRGKYFSNVKYQMFPHFNDFLGELVYCSDTLIKTTVPIDLNVDKSIVTIRYNNVKYSGKEFTLVPNVTISSITPSSGPWNSRIKIRGKNLRVAQTVLFNDIVSPIKFWSDTLLEANVPAGASAINSEVFVKIFNYKLKAPQTFTLLPSTIKSYSHTRVTNGTIVKIKGENFRTESSKIIMSSLEVPITSFSDTLLSFTIPELSSSGTKTLKLSDGLFTYPEFSLEYVNPVATGLNAQLCTWNDTVAIVGTGLDLLSSPTVKISEYNDGYYATTAKIVSTGENEIKFIIPESIDYRTLIIHLTTGNQTKKVGEIKLRNPLIESITYNKDSRTTYIIVNGKYFHPSKSKVQIKSTDFPSYVDLEKVRSSTTEIVCKYPNVPWDTYSLTALNEIDYTEMRSNSNAIELVSPYKLYQKFSNWYREDKYIYVNGDLFCFDYNSNQMHRYNMNTKSTSTNGLYPSYYNSATFLLNSKIYLCTGTAYPDWGYDNQVFTYNLSDSKWESLERFPGLSRNNALGFTIGSKGYLLGGKNQYDNLGEIWEFEPVNGTWTKKQNSQLNAQKPLGVFVYNGEAYIMNDSKLWKYNPTANTLQKITDLPVDQIYWYTDYEQIFNIDNKVYYYGYNALWEFNISTNVWKKALNGRTEGVQWRYCFKHDGKYYLASQQSIYEFDPSKI